MSSYKLLSLDIWDTILRRNCHPDEIKLHTARYIYLKYFSKIEDEYKNVSILLNERRRAEGIIGKKRVAEGFDDEYKLSEVFSVLLTNIFIEKDQKIIKDAVTELIEIELQQEKDVTYLDDKIVQTIDTIDYNELAYISDFYSSKQFLNSLLKKNGFPYLFNHQIVSSEYSFNKRSGRLFSEIQKVLNLNLNEQFHIGDNPHSDYAMPLAKGIHAQEYINKKEMKKKEHYEKLFKLREQGEINYKDYLPQNIDDDIANRDVYYYAQKQSIFFFTFILKIVEESIKMGVEKVYYFTREGEFFSKIHKLIETYNPFKVPIPKAEVLEVSRIATFSPSIREVTLEEMMRIWNMYSTQSLQAFFSTINVQEDEFIDILDRYSIKLKENIQYPWLDSRVQNLFKDLDFKTKLSNIFEMRRNIFYDYLKSKDIENDEKNIFIVDIGWRGTIQDNISYVLPKKQIHGYYLGLFDFINYQPHNVKKYSFISGEAQKYLKHVAPLEMICNSPSGSVVGYEYINGKITASKIIDAEENKIFEQCTSYFQDGVLSKIEEHCAIVKKHAFTSEILMKDAYQALESLITHPNKELAQAFFNLSHNESFGLGKFVSKKIDFPTRIFIKALITKKGKRDFLAFLEKTTWPQAFLIVNNLLTINKMYNKREQRIYNSNSEK